MGTFAQEQSVEVKLASKLNYCAYLPATGDYVTQLLNYPKTNCHGTWGRTGQFWITLHVCQGGKRVGSFTVPRVDEEGTLFADLNLFEKFIDPKQDGILVLETYATAPVPLELYFSHIHKKTQHYISYPAAAYMGDQLYPENHKIQLENSLFWPGVVHQKRCESALVVMNPYSIPISYQVTLFRPDGECAHSKVRKLSALRVEVVPVSEIFPELLSYQSDETDAQYSICATCQFKLISYHALLDTETKLVTSMDHMHVYCLY